MHQRTGEKILPWFPGNSCNNYYDVFSAWLQTDSSLHSRRVEALVRVYTNFLVIFTLSWNYNTFIFVQLQATTCTQNASQTICRDVQCHSMTNTLPQRAPAPAINQQ